MYSEEIGESTWDDITKHKVNCVVTLLMNLRNEIH